MPLVSIITAHFERPALLKQAFAFLQRSTFGDWEWLIVDDGSSAPKWNEVRAMESDRRVRTMRRETKVKGASACRNFGLARASGDYIVILDDDDLLAPWCLEQRLAAVRSHNDAAMWVFPVLLFSQTPGDSDQYWNTMDLARDDLGRFLRSDGPWCISSPLWRREALRAIGGFNELLVYGTDSHLHLRALLSGLQIRQFPQALPDVFVRRGAEPRLTNSSSPALIESRRVRLEEGIRLLQEAGARQEHLRLWEGQYFVEAEFLLFRVPGSRAAIDRVLADWGQHFRPSLARRMVVRSYFRLALASRKNAYLVLRIARRLVMKLLPREFFPQSGSTRSKQAAPAVMQTVRQRLASWAAP